MTPGKVTYPITQQTADVPFPESELLTTPSLTLPPVPFDFSNLKY